jgi:hypothetical protein
MDTEYYDDIIIGGGKAGKSCHSKIQIRRSRFKRCWNGTALNSC